MLEKRTIIDQIEITRNGIIQIRFAKQIVEDGREISLQWHRTSLEPGADLDGQLLAVNLHLQQMGEAACQDAEKLTLLHSVVQLTHTPEVLQRFTDQQAKGIKDII